MTTFAPSGVKLLGAVSAFALFAINSASAQLPGRSAGENDVAFVATIPFAADAGTSILLRVSLNRGTTQWWALDSGASECIVDGSVARKARLVTRGGRELSGTGKGKVHLDSIVSPIFLELAGKPLRTCVHYGALDLGVVSGNGARAISGILGYEFFSRYIVRIDFAKHTLTLYDPAKYRYVGSGDTLELHFDRDLPRIDVRIRTARRPEATRRLIVDTGSEDAVDDSTVRRSPNGPAITISTTGLGASYQAAIGTLDTVRIGRSVFTGLPGVASDVGIVGNAIWSRFVCVFVYAHRRLIIEPRAEKD